MVKRGEKICVGSMVVSFITMTIAASFAVAIGMGGNQELRVIAELLTWIWIISLIPICCYICAWFCDIRQIRSSGTPRSIEPPPVEPKDVGAGIE